MRPYTARCRGSDRISWLVFLFSLLLPVSEVTATEWISEIRGGLLKHDTGPFGNTEEGGVDLNGEVLFRSPEFLHWVWAPRPHLGMNLNTSGDTSQAYLGFSWSVPISGKFWFGFSLGAAVHNGRLDTDDTDRKSLGSRVLFRESLELGYNVTDQLSVSVMLDHSSNAGLADRNEGLDNVGLRLGYRF